jgi:hypothetical protein
MPWIFVGSYQPSTMQAKLPTARTAAKRASLRIHERLHLLSFLLIRSIAEEYQQKVSKRLSTNHRAGERRD